MDVLQFLRFVITTREGGWLPIGASLPDGSGWRMYWRAWPEDADSTAELVQGLKDEGLNVYTATTLFKDKQATKENALDTRTLLCDLDAAEVGSIPVPPSLLLKSSNARHQCYWILDDFIPLDEFEQLNKRIVMGIYNADHTVWHLGHMMRVPTTLNWKYVPQQKVRVVSWNQHTYNPVDFDIFPPLDVSEPLAITVDDEWIEAALAVPVGHNNVTTFWDEIKTKLEKGVDHYFENEVPDRSNGLWRLTTAMFRIGLKREQVYLIAYHSKNNKFKFLRYGGKQELARDVLRAEREVLMGPTGIRGRMPLFRRVKDQAERKQGIAAAVRNQMLTHGRFVHATGGTLWYIPTKEGRPVSISKMSTQLNVILDNMFGLVSTEPEHAYTVQSLINYVAGLPSTGIIASLSYYDPPNSTMLLHMGAKDVLKITPNEITTVVNGHEDIIFLWEEHPTTADILSEHDPDDEWHEALFGMSLGNLSTEGINAEQAMALLRAWFICLLMRNAISSRPILAMFGQPGSGKSSLFNRVYRLLYGPGRAASSLGTQQDFDHAMASDPLHVIDNLDTWERWLPDRIARAAGISEITKRKLYTDTDIVRIRLQAFLGITSHNPKFGREDVMDRLIMITLERIQGTRIEETPMLNAIVEKRPKYWGQIARDMQRVLKEPEPAQNTVAQFRVQDFSKVGQKIANALGFGATFYEAIVNMVDRQKGFILDEDSVLVNIIDQYIKNPRYKNEEFCTPAKLWGYFSVIGGADNGFAKQYGNSVKLGRKLWAMQDALKQRFVMEFSFDPREKTRVWRFLERKENGVEA